MILPITCFDRKDDKVDGVALQTAAATAVDARPRLPEPKTVVFEADVKPVTSTSTTIAVPTRSGRGNNVALQSSPLISSALTCWIVDDPVALRQKAIREAQKDVVIDTFYSKRLVGDREQELRQLLASPMAPQLVWFCLVGCSVPGGTRQDRRRCLMIRRIAELQHQRGGAIVLEGAPANESWKLLHPLPSALTTVTVRSCDLGASSEEDAGSITLCSNLPLKEKVCACPRSHHGRAASKLILFAVAMVMALLVNNSSTLTSSTSAVTEVSNSSFPTEQAMQRKKILERNKALGIVVKKKAQVVEQHFDDCGDNTDPLVEDMPLCCHVD
jgi:hypothetical protein